MYVCMYLYICVLEQFTQPSHNIQQLMHTGTWYYEGKGGLTVDKVKSFQLHQGAAMAGHPLATFNVGVAYLFGEGVTKNIDQAIRHLEIAAKANVEHAVMNLSKIYLEGTLVPRDLHKALHILNTSALLPAGVEDVVAMKEYVEELIRNEEKTAGGLFSGINTSDHVDVTPVK